MQYFGFDRPSFAFETYGFGGDPDAAILALFAGGKQGVWYDPSDKSTLFQDVAGTVPVTKDGDPIGLMKDKSGNGNHATQTVSAARPTYRTDGILHWLQFDGVDDCLFVNYAAGSSWSSHVAITTFNTASAFIFEGYTAGLNNFVYVRPDTSISLVLSPSSLPYTVTRSAITAGAPFVSSMVASGTAATTRLGIGARGNTTGLLYFLNGKVNGLILRNATPDSSEIALAEQYLATKAGVTL